MAKGQRRIDEDEAKREVLVFGSVHAGAQLIGFFLMSFSMIL